MGELLGQLVPVALLGAVAPLPILVVISLLMSPHSGTSKALGFTIAQTVVFAAIGVATLSSSGDRGSGPKGSVITATIVTVLGAVLLLTAVKQILNAPDPDAGPPGFMSRLDSMSVGASSVLGLILGLINVKQVGVFAGGVAQIAAAEVSVAQAWIALAVLVVLIQVGVIAAVLLHVAARTTSERVLGAFRAWLVEHNRILSITIGLVIGTWFVLKGLMQLIA